MMKKTEKQYPFPPITSGMLDKLNEFVVPRSSFGNNELSSEEFQELQKIVNKRRPYRLSDFKKRYIIPDLSDI